MDAAGTPWRGSETDLVRTFQSPPDGYGFYTGWWWEGAPVTREKITWHNPKDEEADFPSIVRVTWDERGEMNPWAPDDYEVVFCEAKYPAVGGIAIR